MYVHYFIRRGLRLRAIGEYIAEDAAHTHKWPVMSESTWMVPGTVED